MCGQIIYEQNAQSQIAPASFVKLLTLYIAFDAIRAGQLKMDDLVTVSEKAWRIDGSKMFIKVGDRVRVEDLLKGIAIASGNDAPTGFTRTWSISDAGTTPFRLRTVTVTVSWPSALGRPHNVVLQSFIAENK